VVLSTFNEAADKDYRIMVLSHCCTDADATVHQVLTNKVFSRQSSVGTLEEWTGQTDGYQSALYDHMC
jgi:nicotinamidase-related amidase